MSVVYFVLLLGGLIFFHEFGHYIVARWMGVHVTTFSIGFGPKIFSFKGRRKHADVEPTEYVIALFPLGGFVAMLGADPNEEVAEAQRPVSFASKAIWRRFLIVSAGPVFNLILPVFIFFFLHLSHSDLAPSSIGTVVYDQPAWEGGIRPGDTITSMNGEAVDYWWQVADIISSHPGEPLAVEVDRHGETLALTVTPEGRDRVHSVELGIVQEKGRVGIAPTYAKSIVSVRAGSVAAKAGLKTWDRVVAIDGQPVDRLDRLEQLLRDASHRPTELSVIRFDATVEAGPLDLALGQGLKVRLPASDESPGRGIGSAEFVIRDVVKGSPAAKIGLKRGDRVLTLDGKRFPMWGFLVDTLVNAPKQTRFTLRWERESGLQDTEPFTTDPDHELGLAFHDAAGRRLEVASVAPESQASRLGLRPGDRVTHVGDLPVDSPTGFSEAMRAQTGSRELRYHRRFFEAEFELARVDAPVRLQPDRKVQLFGAAVFSLQGFPDTIENNDVLGYALHHAFAKSWHAISMNFQAITGLFTGRVPLKELGGPIAIGQLAAETKDRGWSYFFRLMVWLSVSLGLINLLPIPILDGGHILFLAMEGIRRKPVSLRTRQIATYIGFALIIFLMVTAFKNDIQKAFF
jgi:membrane-associated protease RseP (regulator of RpoE activity)